MPRGGRRRGTPGKAYGNRTDLTQAPNPGQATFKGQPYGAASEQAQAQAAVPPQSPPGPPGAPPAAGPPPIPPGGLGAFNRPTERPGEPLTSGLGMGPGAGPEALGMTSRNDPISMQLRALYQQFPIPELADLLDEIQ